MVLLKNKRVFVVEDDVYNLAIASVFLEQGGAQVRFERWGTETVERLRSFSPVDVILLDLMFPRGITGYEIFDKIRNLHEFDMVPIIAVTAADPDTAMKLTRDKGFSGFIAKPISTTFVKYIADVIEGKQVWVASSNNS